MHTVTLFIPALFWPHASADHDSPIVPALQTLIGRSDVSESGCNDEQAWLCQQFGVPRQADWPTAPIALFGAGMPPGEDFWLSADPVHLQVNRNQLILLAPESLSITDAEAVSLCAALNRHFAADGLNFLAPQPHRWYLKTARPSRIHTSSLSRAVGHDVDRMLPEGEDRLAWHRIFNEVQMLLHAHPVNEEREQRAALPINSLWFSGGGTLPGARTSFQAVMGSSVLARGLSKLASIPFTATEQGIDAIAADDVLIELRDAATASMHLDPAAWKEALENLEQRWFAPLAEQLKKGRIRHLVIATVGDGRSHRWTVSRMNLWRWWRPAGSLSTPLHRP
ncbi:MAG: hypothetical protein HY067_20250 [Betaproteobacteria bacterium]|nr:hypothetical protein [Betaproteobacteria bacterium]